jgi:hypothetical protein
MEDIQRSQEFLQSAQETLAAETQEMVKVSNRMHDNIVKAMRLMWRQLFFIWGVVIVLLIAYFLLLHNASSTRPVAAPVSKPAPQSLPSSATIVSPQTPPAQQVIKTVPIPEWEAITELLEQVRQAQLKKDIGLFLEAYAPTYPHLDKKKESILKTWEKYDYLDMHFTIENIQKADAHTIIATVIWDMTLEDVLSKKKSALVKDYTVHFSQVSGKWLIQELIQEEKTSEKAARFGCLLPAYLNHTSP